MADGIKRVAKAYYERANEEEKKEAKEYFTKLDLDGDGKISFAEFKKGVRSWLSADDVIFKKLDPNSDGALYFPDVLVLFYYHKGAISIHRCDGCREGLLDPYFTCFHCLPNWPKTYDLCCACYRGGRFKHDHPLRDLLHVEAAHSMFNTRYTQAQAKSGMEGFGRIAKAYYERASEEERNEAQAFFKKFDSNGDGKISLVEYNRNVTPWMSGEEVFRKLDSNSDGALDFSDVLVLFYEFQGAMVFYGCDGCGKKLFDPYISCYQCLCELSTTYDLCCDCYLEGKFKHQHPLSDLMHDQVAHLKFFYRMKAQAKSEMEQLGEIARAHYRAGSPKVQDLAKEFFNSMDTDGDGQVDLAEFMSFLRQQGYWQMRNREFFKKLDKNGNGSLDFWEVMTLYYIVKSGRPFCDGCGEFIPGIFFSCVECYKGNPESSFNLCHQCYQSANCKHNHNGRTQFLDNHTLLQATRDSALGQATGVTTMHEQPMKAQSTSSTPSTVTIPINKKNKMDLAFKALEIGLAIGNVSTTLCTIL